MERKGGLFEFSIAETSAQSYSATLFLLSYDRCSSGNTRYPQSGPKLKGGPAKIRLSTRIVCAAFEEYPP